MITEVYFIEGFYLYTEFGSSCRGVLVSKKGDPGTLGDVLVHVRGERKGHCNWWGLLEKIALCVYVRFTIAFILAQKDMQTS
jgi:hypothetical protein